MKDHFSKENLETIVKESKSKAEVLRKLGLAAKGGNYSNLDRWIEEYSLDTSHFTGQLWNKGQNTPINDLEDILKPNTNYSSNRLKDRLVTEGLKEDKCEVCGLPSEWNGKSLVLQLHHLDGDHYNNSIENLQVICPNCHSQTETYCSRTKTKTVRKKKPNALTVKINPEKICPICGKTFKPERSTKTYCSRDCYNKSLLQNKEESSYTEENLTKLCNECATITEIAEKLNTSRPTVRKYLEKFGLLDTFKDKYDFHSKKIGQYDTKGNLIKEWPSVTDAEETLNLTDISKCLSGKRRSCGGYIWKEI